MKNDLWINSRLLHTRVQKKLNAINKKQDYIPKKIGITIKTFSRMAHNKPMTTDSFLKVINWLDQDPNKFIFRGTKSLAEIYTTKKRKNGEIY